MASATPCCSLSQLTYVYAGKEETDDRKKFIAATDPDLALVRNHYMFQAEDTISFETGVMSALARGGVRPKARAARKVRVAKAETEQAAWVECMQLVHLHQDKAAFAKLFAHFAPRVKAFLMKSGADASLAEECSQEVMATVWRKAHLFDPSRASVATWIFTIARNRKIDALRKQRRPEPEDIIWGPEEEPDQADVMALQQESDQLAKAMADLPEKQRVLIEQAYFGDLSHSEIAEATGLPLGTIKSRIRLALDRLRHTMK